MNQRLSFHALCCLICCAISFNKCMCVDKNSKIVVIGAGIAGLGATERLINEYGFKDVTILEALDRVGGRIHPIIFGNSVLELGAEWIHGRNNSVYRLAEQLGVLASQSRAQRRDGNENVFYTRNGCKLSTSQNRKLKNLADEVMDRADSAADEFRFRDLTTYGQLYQNAYQKYLLENPPTSDVPKSYYDAMMVYLKKRVEEEYSASDWYQMSPRSSSEWTEVVGNPDYILGPMGYKPILDYYVNRIPQNRIRLNSQVTKIVYNNDSKVRLHLAKGDTLYADYVIVTSSIGYLKQNARDMFEPSLPQNTLNTIMNLGYDTVDKIFLVYNRSYPFWNDQLDSINLLRVDNDLRVCLSFSIPNESRYSQMFYNFGTKPYHDNVLMAWISGTDPDIMEQMNDNQLIEWATYTLQRFTNNGQIPKPNQIIRTSWKSNPLFLGSYSYYSVDCDKIRCQRSTLQQPLFVTRNGRKIPVIMFAGEATSEHEFQTTHGALASGQREAKRINDFS